MDMLKLWSNHSHVPGKLEDVSDRKNVDLLFTGRTYYEKFDWANRTEYFPYKFRQIYKKIVNTYIFCNITD